MRAPLAAPSRPETRSPHPNPLPSLGEGVIAAHFFFSPKSERGDRGKARCSASHKCGREGRGKRISPALPDLAEGTGENFSIPLSQVWERGLGGMGRALAIGLGSALAIGEGQIVPYFLINLRPYASRSCAV